MKKTLLDWIRSWVEKAGQDLQAARHVKRKKGLRNICCFHAQQAGEKYLKAYLTWLGVDVPKTHHIEDLVELIAQKDSGILAFKGEWAKLTPYAVESRYPEFSVLPAEKVREAVLLATQIKEYVMLKLPKSK